MTLDATKPNDTNNVSELASYIRETRNAVNGVSAGNDVGVTNLDMASGTTSLTVGTEIGNYGYETLILASTLGASVLATILGGVEGKTIAIIFQDALVDITDGGATKDNGEFYLDQLPAGSDFDAQIDDVLILVNVGGDGGATTHGYWKEINRVVSVR